MKENVRENILAVAQRLFNEKGYRQTSMREIAKEMHISVGNLTYHFPKKENLMMALLKLPDFTKEELPDSYNQLFQLFNEMIDSLIVNRFFYTEDELSRSTEEFYRHNVDNVSSIEQHLRMSLQYMQEEGLFLPWGTGELEAFTTMIMYSHMTWIKYSFFRKKKDCLSKQKLLLCHYNLLLCRVPKKHWKDYEKVKTML